ncbi:MAG: pteridine reductase [Gammaproteobacteria bacterium]
MNNTEALHGKTALITGAARRVGATIAECLHQAGMDVVIHYYTSSQAAAALAQRLNQQRPGSALTIKANLQDSRELQPLVQQAIAFKGRLDALVNNASAFYPTPLADVNEDQWQELLDVNLKAPLFLTRHAAAELKQRQGCVVNLTDIHAERTLTGYPVYSVSKAGLVTLTRALAKALAPEVRVNAVAPGAILWPEDMDNELQQNILDRIPLRRRGEPDDIARAVRYMIADADYVTGQILNVDGGRTLDS